MATIPCNVLVTINITTVELVCLHGGDIRHRVAFSGVLLWLPVYAHAKEEGASRGWKRTAARLRSRGKHVGC